MTEKERRILDARQLNALEVRCSEGAKAAEATDPDEKAEHRRRAAFANIEAYALYQLEADFINGTVEPEECENSDEYMLSCLTKFVVKLASSIGQEADLLIMEAVIAGLRAGKQGDNG